MAKACAYLCQHCLCGIAGVGEFAYIRISSSHVNCVVTRGTAFYQKQHFAWGQLGGKGNGTGNSCPLPPLAPAMVLYTVLNT